MRRTWYLGFGIVLIAIFLTLVMLHDVRWFLVVAIPLMCVGIYDLLQKKHALLRNFPVLGHIRFILEFFRPEVQQYFIADDISERPFNRETRKVIYERAKDKRDTQPFGTAHDVTGKGYEYVTHSLAPKHISEVDDRVMVGGPQCKQPYNASRLNISAMSFGALSSNAIMALNQGAKIAGCAHNTGEGGLSPYHLQGGDIIFQIGTGYFGCRNKDGGFDAAEFKKEATRPEVKMIEIKLSQGAKPAHGGILPAAKLSPEIAQIRKVQMGHDVLSPPAHSAFNSPKGLLEFVQQLRELSGGKPVGFKLCLGRRGQFLGICKAMVETKILPDFITIDGAEGGTGAAPPEFSDHIGVPLEDGLSFVHNALIGVGVRENIRIIASGKIASGFDMVTKIAMGADLCNSARAMMLSLGCIQSKQCNANTCPTGVATQDKRLQKGLVVEQKRQRVANYHKNTMHTFLEIIGAMGIDTPSDINPLHVKRRISDHEVKSYAEIFPTLKKGALLAENIPQNWQAYWAKANVNAFL